MNIMTILSIALSTTFIFGSIEVAREQPAGRRRTIGWCFTLAFVLQACTTLVLWKAAIR